MKTHSHKQCKAAIYKRDQYRLLRGRGFKLHHCKFQCSRLVVLGTDFCYAHQARAGAPDNYEQSDMLMETTKYGR